MGAIKVGRNGAGGRMRGPKKGPARGLGGKKTECWRGAVLRQGATPKPNLIYGLPLLGQKTVHADDFSGTEPAQVALHPPADLGIQVGQVQLLLILGVKNSAGPHALFVAKAFQHQSRFKIAQFQAAPK